MKTGIGRQVTESRLFGPQMLEDPYPVYRRLQEETPVRWDDGLNAWIVTRHEDVTAILKDVRFSSERVRPTVDRLYPDPKYAPLFDVLSLTMVNRDDPDHARLRKLVHYAFQRTEVTRWEAAIRAIVDELIDGMLAKAGSGGATSATDMPLPRPSSGSRGRRDVAGTPVDFVRDFAVPLPVRAISEIVGVPEADRVKVKGWCDDFAQIALNFYAHLSPAELDRGLAGVMAFRDYLAEKAAWHRDNPPTVPRHPDGPWVGGRHVLPPNETLLAHLVHAEEDDRRLTLDELLANTLLLLAAGNETTTSLMANGLLALLRNPEEMARLKADPSLIPAAVDEFLRYEPPVQFLGRLATEDIELHGETIRQGQLAIVVMAAANRDPAAFEAPDALAVERYAGRGTGGAEGGPNARPSGLKSAHHLSFGHGRHLCTGMQLAKLEANIAFDRLLARLPAIELADPEIRHQPNFNMRCPERLLIRLGAAEPVPGGEAAG